MHKIIEEVKLPNEELNTFNQQSLDNIADALSETGYIVLNNALNNSLLKKLQQRIKQIPSLNWQQAGIGRKQGHHVNKDIRSDKISWIKQDNAIESEFLDCMETLRSGMNQRLYLGLFDYESHFAIYPQGSFYQKHVDALKGKSNRVLSTVLYLNDDWQTDNGGELLVYQKSQSQAVHTVLPQLGTLVVFLSEDIPHEVLIANRERHSIAGWFRLNPSRSQCVDPSN